MSDEAWRDIPGYEGYYQASDAGRVRAVPRLVARPVGGPQPVRGRIMTPYTVASGHQVVALTRDGKGRKRPVHRLVLSAFVGPCPDGMEACHNNGVASDNRLSNLRWDTHSSNLLDQTRHGVHNQASKTHCPQGHEYSPENTYVRPNGDRMCKPCNAEWARLRRARRSGAAA